MFMASSAHVTREIYTCLGELTLNIVVGLHVTLAFLLWMIIIVVCSSSKYFRVLIASLNVLVQSRSIRIWKCRFLRRKEDQST